MAERIVAYRLQNGPFTTIEDVQNVPGIKGGIFARIREFITAATR
ncbi:MAG: ComEA family DNA-binding protein [Chloroflexia bacterium]